jgi:hypothetical protein
MYVLKVYILKQKQTTSVVKIASEKFYNLNHLVLTLLHPPGANTHFL